MIKHPDIDAIDRWAANNPQDHPLSLEAIRRELRQVDQDIKESQAISMRWQGVTLIGLAIFLAALWCITMRGGM